MAVTDVYTLYAVQTPAGIFDQIQSFSVDPGVSEVLGAGDGLVDAEFVAAIAARPRIGFTTTACDQSLGLAGVGGLSIAAAADMFFQALQLGGTRKGATSHMKLTASLGMLLPRTLTATQGAPASISYELIPVSSDGATAPIVTSTGQSLSGSPANGEMQTLGAVTINGAALDAVQGVSINFGLEEVVRGGGGDTYDTFVAVMNRRPSISIQTLDVEQLDTLGLAGLARASATTVTLRTIAEGGVVGSAAITATVNEGRMRVGPLSSDHGADAGCEIVITPTFDGVNDPIVIS